MRPGLTASQSWHNTGLDLPDTGGAEIRHILLIWILLPVIASGGALAGISADQVSTSVFGDGSVLSSSTWLSDGTVISGRILGTGMTRIDQKTGSEDDRTDLLLAGSEGTLLIGEYASVEEKSTDLLPACVFSNRTDQKSLKEIKRSGILRHGNYSRNLNIRPFESSLLADGTGMMEISHRLAVNDSLSGRTVATGNLSISEEIVSGLDSSS